MNASEIVLGILLKGAPTNDDYVATIENVPVMAVLSASILLERKPTNKELLSIIFKIPQYRSKAWEKLLQQQPTNDEIIQVIENVDDLRRDAWEQLLKQSPTNSELIRIVNSVRALEITVWQYLTQRSLSEAELRSVYDHHCERANSSLRVLAASMLTRLDSQNETLMKIICKEVNLREVAIRLLLQKAPSKKEVRDTLRGFEIGAAISEEVCQWLMQGESSEGDLQYVAVFSGDKIGDEAAEKLLSQQYQNDLDERISCYAVLHRPTFARNALKRILAIMDRKPFGEEAYAGDLWNLYSNLVELEAQNDLRVNVARKFLQAVSGMSRDDRYFMRGVSIIRERHPELKI